MINIIEEIHKESICLFKIETFYHTYGRDAYILSYLFDYKIRFAEKDTKECGFPVTSVSKICAKLEKEKINYLLIDNRNNYYVDQECKNGNLNRYKEVYEKL